MKRYWGLLARSASILMLFGAIACAAPAAGGAGPAAGRETVTLDGHPVFVIDAAPAGVTLRERATLIEERLAATVRDARVGVEAIQANPSGDAVLISDGQRTLVYVTDQDAAVAGETREALAAAWVGAIRAAVTQDRAAHSRWHLIEGLVAELAATFALVLLIASLHWLTGRARTAVARRRELGTLGFDVGGSRLGGDQVGNMLLGVSRVVRVLVIAFLLYSWVVFTLRLLPGANSVRLALRGFALTPLIAIWGAFVGYLPNLFFLAAIMVMAYGALRLSNYLFEQIDRGAVMLAWFARDLALPTAKLVKFGLLVAALVAAFPYLPGAKSPAFQGISIFLGVLFSFGSSSAISNVVAGVILLYMRPFQPGDRVSIAGSVGDVVERTVLVTRLRTIKNEIVTIPNAAVMANHIVNYSAPTRAGGLILHTTVTIGYDAPWRKVHELMLAAARATPGILSEPAPFVLQTALNDFYVAYQINAHTADAHHMAQTYSALHANIQDSFNEGGIEINSPHYASVRDGNRIAVPDAYLPPGYRVQGFRVDGQDAVTRDRAPASER